MPYTNDPYHWYSRTTKAPPPLPIGLHSAYEDYSDSYHYYPIGNTVKERGTARTVSCTDKPSAEEDFYLSHTSEENELAMNMKYSDGEFVSTQERNQEDIYNERDCILSKHDPKSSTCAANPIREYSDGELVSTPESNQEDVDCNLSEHGPKSSICAAGRIKEYSDGELVSTQESDLEIALIDLNPTSSIYSNRKEYVELISTQDRPSGSGECAESSTHSTKIKVHISERSSDRIKHKYGPEKIRPTTLTKISREDTSERRSLTKISQEDTSERRSLTKVSQEGTSDRSSLTKISREDTSERRSLTKISQEDTSDKRSLTEISQEDTSDRRSLTKISQEDTSDRRSLTKVRHDGNVHNSDESKGDKRIKRVQDLKRPRTNSSTRGQCDIRSPVRRDEEQRSDSANALLSKFRNTRFDFSYDKSNIINEMRQKRLKEGRYTEHVYNDSRTKSVDVDDRTDGQPPKKRKRNNKRKRRRCRSESRKKVEDHQPDSQQSKERNEKKGSKQQSRERTVNEHQTKISRSGEQSMIKITKGNKRLDNRKSIDDNTRNTVRSTKNEGKTQRQPDLSSDSCTSGDTSRCSLSQRSSTHGFDDTHVTKITNLLAIAKEESKRLRDSFAQSITDICSNARKFSETSKISEMEANVFRRGRRGRAALGSAPDAPTGSGWLPSIKSKNLLLVYCLPQQG